MLGLYRHRNLRAGLFILATTVLWSTWSIDAEARVGRGRSVGRPSSARGFGYRRSPPVSRPPASSPPGAQPQDGPYGSRPGAGGNPRDDAPAGGGAGYGSSRPASGPTTPMGAPPAPMTPPPARGGFWRGVAGGLAGGFLGSMLFGSLGHSNSVAPSAGWGSGSGVGGGVGSAAGGGGIGLFEVLLFAGIAYLGFRWWKKNQSMTGTVLSPGPSSDPWPSLRTPPVDAPRFETPAAPLLAQEPLPQMPSFPALAATPIDPDAASDLFFRIQAAWTRRDLTSVLDRLVPEVRTQLEDDLKELRTRGQINRLENISLRKVEVLDSWREGDTENSAVRFSASLLDYTVDETTHRVVEGSDTAPVKFAEDWVFARDSGGTTWRLASIEEAAV